VVKPKILCRFLPVRVVVLVNLCPYADYSHGHQYSNYALYLTFFGGKSSNVKYIEKEGFKQNVIVNVIPFMPWLGK